MLADYLVTRLVTVLLAAQRMLLFNTRISVTRILPLVGWQRGGCRSGIPVPAIPTASTVFPVPAPVLTPTGGSIALPTPEIQGRLAIVAYGNPQDIQRHNLRPYYSPGTVVPGTGIPVVVQVNPVHAIVKEIVGIQVWSVVDRVARHQDEFRVKRQVDPDAHTG